MVTGEGAIVGQAPFTIPSSPVQAVRGCIVYNQFKNSTKINSNEGQASFYYHHALEILNKVNDKIFSLIPLLL